MAEAIELLVNGKPQRVPGPAERTLLSVLRDDLELTGCKYGCGEGQCGACTVLVDGKAVRSCITKAGDCRDKPITTIESLEQDGRLHPLQEAFLAEGALQCGYCTCGMILSALAFLQKTPQPRRRRSTTACRGTSAAADATGGSSRPSKRLPSP